MIITRIRLSIKQVFRFKVMRSFLFNYWLYRYGNTPENITVLEDLSFFGSQGFAALHKAYRWPKRNTVTLLVYYSIFISRSQGAFFGYLIIAPEVGSLEALLLRFL